jgi:hypothetical protein
MPERYGEISKSTSDDVFKVVKVIHTGLGMELFFILK